MKDFFLRGRANAIEEAGENVNKKLFSLPPRVGLKVLCLTELGVKKNSWMKWEGEDR